ncbi:hypothetical protein [Virgisporangium ochraceum]|uniref:Uncharacterized protein n=1 Tax=Virgisporangium ochraceum TaxID=65505 RepID=A0A8J4EI22_9ACTN|nr:hypothetical protein [Virgisporangium ochraceum]GIJ75296.1 hypothetical protein Voc01_102130 [Virgisporangium ochraceum]
MSTDGQVAGRAPIYARLLRLRRIKITGLMSFLLLECTIAVAILLALAELVSWWAVPLLPILVAVMVKVNDMVGGPAKTPVAAAVGGARASRVPPQRDEVSEQFFDDEPLPDEVMHADLPDARPAARFEAPSAAPSVAPSVALSDAREPAPVERERVEVRTGGWTVDRPTEEIMLPAALTGRPRQRQAAWTERAAMEHAATTEFQMITDDPAPEHGVDARGYAQDHSRAARAVNEAYAAYESPDDAPAGHAARSSREVYETHEFPGVRDTADGYGREVYETHEFPSVRDTADAYGGQTYGAQQAGYGYGSRQYDGRDERADREAGYGYAASSGSEHGAGERAQSEAHGYAEHEHEHGAYQRYTAGGQAGYETAHEHAPANGYPEGYAAQGYGEQGYGEQGYGEQGYGERGYGAGGHEAAVPDHRHAAAGYTTREATDSRYASGEHEVHGYATHEHTAYASSDYTSHDYTSGQYASNGYADRAHAASAHTASEYAASEYAASEYTSNEYAAGEHRADAHDYDSGERRHAASENAYEYEAAYGYTDREHAGNQRVAAYEQSGRDTSNSGRHAALAPSAQWSGDPAALAPSAQWSGDPAPVAPSAHRSGDHTPVAPSAQRSEDYADRAEPVWPAEVVAAGNTWSMAETVPAVPVVPAAHPVREAHAVREAGAHGVPADSTSRTTPAAAFPAQAAPVARPMSAGSLAAAGSALTARGRSAGEAPQRPTEQARAAAPARGADDRPQQPARQGASHAASYWSRVAAGQGPGMAAARPEGGVPPNLPGAAAPRRAQLFGAAVRRSMAAQAQQIGMNALGGTTRGASTRRTRDAGSDSGRHSRGEGNGTGRQGIRFNDRGFGRLRDA